MAVPLFRSVNGLMSRGVLATLSASLLMGGLLATPAAAAELPLSESDAVREIANEHLAADVAVLPVATEYFSAEEKLELEHAGVDATLYQAVVTDAVESETASTQRLVLRFADAVTTITAVQANSEGTEYAAYVTDAVSGTRYAATIYPSMAVNPLSTLCAEGSGTAATIIAGAASALPPPYGFPLGLAAGFGANKLSGACARYNPLDPMYVYLQGPFQGNCIPGGCRVDTITNYTSRPGAASGRLRYYDMQYSDRVPIWDWQIAKQVASPDRLANNLWRQNHFLESGTFYGSCKAEIVYVLYTMHFDNGRSITFQDGAPVTGTSGC